MLAVEPPHGRNISLRPSELRRLRSITRNQDEDATRRIRARVILRAACCHGNAEIGKEFGLDPYAVDELRNRFARCRWRALDEQFVETEPPEQDPSEATRITLRGRERRALQRIVAAHKSEQRMVLRANIVLAASLGRNNCQIAFQLGCDLKTVRKWRSRFAEDRMLGLYDLPRTGRPRRFDATHRHDVIATILGPPPAPYDRWSLDLAAAALVDRGIVPSISRETISHWLRTADIKPHRCRYWLNSKDPDFKAKMDRVVELYTKKPHSGRVICIDEKTCIQARERRHPDHPVGPGRPRRPEFEYKRHGVVHLIAAYEVHTGRVIAECLKGKNDSQAFIRFVRRLRKEYPREKLYLVLDNGTTHRSEATTEFLAKYPRLVPVFLPTHASWLNQIEIWFSVLTRQALKDQSFRSQDELIDHIQHYVAVHNETATPYRWTKKGDPLRR